MPTSHWQQLNEIVGTIISVNPKSMLDIGVGFGKYGMLSREYLELWDGRNKYDDWNRIIDGIEAFKQYKNKLYEFIYNNVYYGNVLDILPNINKQYDLILLIDVLEHFDKSDGKKLLELCMKKSANILIATPHNPSKQEDVFDNEYEEHKSKWTKDDFNINDTLIIPNRKSLICLIGKDSNNKSMPSSN